MKTLISMPFGGKHFFELVLQQEEDSEEDKIAANCIFDYATNISFNSRIKNDAGRSSFK
jgi:hypothetical protein